MGKTAATLSLALVCLFCSAATAAQSLSHAPDPMFHDGLEGVSAGPFNDSDASRFLAQATFGPTDADIAHLRNVGYQAWLNEQFNATPTYEITDQTGQTAYLNWVQNTLGESIGQSNRQEAWFLGALGGLDPQYPTTASHDHKDQLRQRVAFALSEILVISDQNVTLGGYAAAMAKYYDLLIKDAFGNYRTLLQDVTLSPAMGVYLNMMGNRRADLTNNIHPDENYGREINQLFSVGLVMLNPDGTPQLSGGQPIPTYVQGTITNFAHVFTGWNWADCDKQWDYSAQAFTGKYYDYFLDCFTPYYDPQDFVTPMAAYETKPADAPIVPYFDFDYHDNGEHQDDLRGKQLLAYTGAANGGVLADGGTAASDLQFALDNIFHHPNVGPFISKQLIQRLVTSNPSPAYVKRVASVFNNDGSGARGNLKAVVKAILLDPEARYGQWQSPDTFGKLREPLLVLTHFWRAMHAVHHCGQNKPAVGTPGSMGYQAPINYVNPYRYAGYDTAWNTSGTQYTGVDQAALDAFTVFNFFKPGFAPSGEITARGLVAPEFQLQTDSIIANSTNTMTGWTLYGNQDVGDTCDMTNDLFGDVKIDHLQDIALAGHGSGGPGDPADALVDAYNHRFMSGQMSPFMRQTLLDLLNVIDSSWAQGGEDWRVERTNRALFLVLSSPEYMIQK